MVLIEYGALGLLAGLIGATSGGFLAWVLGARILDIAWTFRPETTLGAIAATTVVVGAVGALASVDVLRKKPLAVLRAG
jgi:putative ABC transport system permease protein